MKPFFSDKRKERKEKEKVIANHLKLSNELINFSNNTVKIKYSPDKFYLTETTDLCYP